MGTWYVGALFYTPQCADTILESERIAEAVDIVNVIAAPTAIENLGQTFLGTIHRSSFTCSIKQVLKCRGGFFGSEQPLHSHPPNTLFYLNPDCLQLISG